MSFLTVVESAATDVEVAVVGGEEGAIAREVQVADVGVEIGRGDRISREVWIGRA